MEVNAPSAGVLQAIAAAEGAEVAPGAVLGSIAAGGAAAAAPKPAAAAPAAIPHVETPRPVTGPVAVPGTHAPLPAAAKMMAEKGASAEAVGAGTGKVYYDLLQERRDKGVDDVAIVRVEQMFPFPKNSLAKALAPFKNAEVVWCQEEPENMGAWTFMDRRIEGVLKTLDIAAKRPDFVGREEAASPATGLARIHQQQQEALVRAALGL